MNFAIKELHLIQRASQNYRNLLIRGQPKATPEVNLKHIKNQEGRAKKALNGIMTLINTIELRINQNIDLTQKKVEFLMQHTQIFNHLKNRAMSILNNKFSTSASIAKWSVFALSVLFMESIRTMK